MADATNAHARWQQAATSSDSASVLDVVRNIAGTSSPWPILVRALVVTPVYLRVSEEGRVETSRADDEDYVHAYSSPLRLTAGLSADVEELTIREVFVADLVNQAGRRIGIRIDPGLGTEQVVLLVGGRPSQLAELLDLGTHGVDLGALPTA